MKSIMLKPSTLMALLLLVLTSGMISCSKKSNNNTTPVVNNGINRYQIQNGVCVDTYTNQQMNQNFCFNNGVNNGQYTWNGYNCVDVNGQVVGSQFCFNQNGYGTQQSCYGYYYQSNNQYGYNNPYGTGYGYNTSYGYGGYGYGYNTGYGYGQAIQCNGTNCSGMTLIEANTNRTVTCY